MPWDIKNAVLAYFCENDPLAFGGIRTNPEPRAEGCFVLYEKKYPANNTSLGKFYLNVEEKIFWSVLCQSMANILMGI